MKKRIAVILLAMTMTLSFAACAPQESQSVDTPSAPQESSSASVSTQEDGPLVPYPETVVITRGVSAMPNSTANFPEGDNYENNDYTRYVKDRVNVEVQSAWEVDGNNFAQKVALSIAAKDIPDTMMVDRALFQQLADNDLLADLTNLYDKYVIDYIRERYDSYEGRCFKEVTVNGKLLGLPETAIAGQEGILWMRKDWLDKLGLGVPESMEEFENAIRAFVEQDPGGNGPGRTVGLTMDEKVWVGYNSHHGINNIFSVYDAYPGSWLERDGKIVWGSTLPEMKPALQKLQDMYQEGLIDKEFAIHKGADRDELVASGRLGAFFGPWWGYGGIPESVTNNPEADWVAIAGPQDANGKMKAVRQDPIGQILVVSKDCEQPEAVLKVLSALSDMNAGLSEEGLAAVEVLNTHSPGMMWSVSPTPLQVTYEDTLDTGMKNIYDAVEARDPSLLVELNDFTIYEKIVADIENPKMDLNNWHERLCRFSGIGASMSEDVEWMDVAYYGKTETMATKWSNLQKLENDFLVKVIMGEQPVDSFDKFVQQWSDMGGAEITAEVEEACAK